MKIFYITARKVLIISLLLNSFLFAQILNTRQISISEGLSNSNVKEILQDKYGFVWIATSDGLNRYDGYEFKVFKNVPGNSKSIIGNEIWDIAEDKNGNLWTATNQGVSYYNRFKNEFKQYDLESFSLASSTTPKTVSCLINGDDVFVGSIGSGLLKLNKETDKFEKIDYSDSVTNANSRLDFVFPMTMAGNRLWFMSFENGLCNYNFENNNIELAEFENKKEGKQFFDNFERGTKLFADANGVLWIISEFAIYKYYLESKKLVTLKDFSNRSDKNILNLNNAFALDPEGNLWAAKDRKALMKFDGISDDYKIIKIWEDRDISGKNTNYITSLMFDNTGILWIGTSINGMFLYDQTRAPFVHYKYDPIDENTLSGNEIFSVIESKIHPGRLYVGTRGTGLNILESEKNQIQRISLKLKNDMFGGSVRSILENADGSLYLGTWGSGILKYTNGKITTIASFDSSTAKSLSDNLVRILKKDKYNKIWVGTNNGLDLLNPDNNKITRIYDKKFKAYDEDLIIQIKEKLKKHKDIASILKVGDSQNLSQRFQIDKPREFLIVAAGEDLVQDTSQAADFGWLENSKGEILWTSDTKKSYHLNGAIKNRIYAGVVKLIPENYALRYKSDESHSYGKWNADAPSDSALWGIQLISLSDEEINKSKDYLSQSENQILIDGVNIRSILLDDDIVWIGSDAAGLNKYNQSTGEVKVYHADQTNPKSISNNSIQFIHQDENGILWLATNGGLNKFDPKTEEATVFTEEDGLPTNYIASILEDDSGSLWLSTRNGLSRMSYDNEAKRATFVNYDIRDGLGGSDFIAQVACKTSYGKFYFGGEHGLNEFSPHKMNTIPPEIVLTDLKISNRSVRLLGDESPLQKPIMDTKALRLNYSQNDLSFEFAALHYSRSDKNQYAHILEGFDDEWQYDKRKFAIYTNLDPGEYTFRVKGSNADGVWNYEGASIKIKINPPWWKTTIAYVFYGVLFVGLIFGVDRIQRKRLLTKLKERRRIEDAEQRAETAELQARASEAERKMLEVEFQQKKKELEEARHLQLSMLPKELPQLPNLDIAVYMKTATEVGGDYYDFHVAMDGTLTVVLGDATGHGMKAGTMVTSAKSLFNVLAPNPDIVLTFHEMTRCLKLMQMDKLSMCMTMLKIRGREIQMSAAGMPPVFIYKKDEQVIEEHVMKGMPLGTMNDFPYTIKESTLSSGDTILMMSDGFPELMNENKELLGYKEARNKFEQVAELSPEEIIRNLKEEGSQWAGEADPNDDVTFVVLKVK